MATQATKTGYFDNMAPQFSFSQQQYGRWQMGFRHGPVTDPTDYLMEIRKGPEADEFTLYAYDITGDRAMLLTSEEMSEWIAAYQDHEDLTFDQAFEKVYDQARKRTPFEDALMQQMIDRWNAVNLIVNCAVTF